MTYSFEIRRRRAYFTRYGVGAHILKNGVECEDVPWFQARATFYGKDGRSLRAEALRWAREESKG